MKTIRKLVHREIITAVAFVTLGFLALFFFFDLIDELRWVGRSPGGGYEVSHAMLFVALSIPSHLYELLPITVLIGTIFVMARLAQSSEFTIMRTSGLGPGRALRTLLTLGGMFVLLTFTVGDYLAPLSDRAAQLVKASQLGRLTTGATGAWLKERQEGHSFAVNVRSINPDGSMHDVRIFEFDAEGRLVSKTKAVSAQVEEDGAWTLGQAQRSAFQRLAGDEARVQYQNEASLRWPTQISADMVAAAVLKPDRMATLDLFQYIRHLQAMKTGALIRFAAEAGAILAAAPPKDRVRLQRFGEVLGFAFQIADDLLDVEGDASEVGKAVAKDAAAGKATLVSLMGIEAARARLLSLEAEAVALLAPYGDRAQPLIEAARFVVNRRS